MIDLSKKKREVEKLLKQYDGVLSQIQEKNGVIGILAKFEWDPYWKRREFSEQNPKWRATCNLDEYVEFIYLNEQGISLLRDKGFKI